MRRFFMFSALLALLVISGPSCRADTTHHEHKNSTHGSPVPSGEINDGIRVIKLTASRYKFEPDPIIVKLEERVRLIATSKDVTHGISIPEFGVNLTIPAGEPGMVEFVADKEGTFHAHCSVYCGPGHGHMHGAFVVIK